MYSFTLCLVNWGRNHKSLVRKDMLQIKPRLSPFLPLNCAMRSFSVYFSALALYLNFKWKHLLIRFRSQGHVTEMGSVLAYFKMCSTFFNSIISEGLQAFFLLYVHKYCLIILDLDRICWHICLLPFLKLLGFFFKQLMKASLWWEILTLKLQLGLAFFLFCFSFFNQPS